MVGAIKNIFAIPDLRKRVLFTFAMLAVYRIGGHIPTPGINSDALLRMFERQQGGILGFVDMFSGGYFSQLTIFALEPAIWIRASRSSERMASKRLVWERMLLSRVSEGAVQLAGT